ncbi:Protein ApaG [Acetobacteraceae bacterium EV16G]|uniref:Protein ApaG n=1 Tax=Sorlinia euscelidii TaxID=3081148 RepID=A0ABU7U4U7_9PROT
MADRDSSSGLLPQTSGEFSDILDAHPAFEARTGDIVVTVRPFWLDDQSAPDEHRYVWAYTIQVENNGAQTIQILSRHWCITDGSGRSDHVHGEGIIGEQPIIASGAVFEYTSGAALHTPSGIMQGTYHVIIPSTGQRFDVLVPTFSLDSPHYKATIH